MERKYRVTFPGLEYECKVVEGTLISDVLKSERLQFSLPCNGQGTCGKCRVKVGGQLTPPTTADMIHLEPEELAAGIRLACQTKVTGELTVKLPDQNGPEQILSSGFLEVKQRDPLFQQLIIPEPVLINWENIASQLPSGLKPSLNLLRQIPRLPKGVGHFQVDIFAGHAVDINPPTPDPRYAVAVDLGTTTLVAYLIDFSSGRIVKTASIYNPQGSFGADVLSRIGFAAHPGGLKQLYEIIRDAIRELIRQLTVEAGMASSDIWQVNIVGNTCMTHLFLGVDPVNLGAIPFTPVFRELIELQPESLGINIKTDGLFFVLPGIGGFVGSDTVAGILACDLSPKRAELLIDIGTNGEMVLAGRGRMLACSTAAGPAFEGARISCGMMASPGAITDIQIRPDGEPVLVTIGNIPPQGICGTGLIRILVELIQKGVITATGRFHPKLADPRFDPEQKRYYLLKRPENPIFISVQDIREFQLAKGAIRAGIELMLKQLDMNPEDLTRIYLAGAFGTYIKPEDAIFLGLLPPVPPARIKAAGNTAGMGAIISILSHTALTGLARITQKVEHVELAGIPEFTTVFADAMLFPNGEEL